MVSKPAHPDNFHQTIIQPSSPPKSQNQRRSETAQHHSGKADRRTQGASAIQSDCRQDPRRGTASRTREQAPSPTQEDTANPVMAYITPSTFKPSMPVPVAQAAAARKSSSGTGNIQAPNVSAATSGDSTTLAVISPDPSGAMAMSQIVFASRQPERRILPVSGTDKLGGSPGGSGAGVTGGGAGAPGKGGDGSVGPGSASTGGGGLAMSEGPVTISGAGTNAGASGMLGAALARGIVYPVPAAFNVRRNSLIVSARPDGWRRT